MPKGNRGKRDYEREIDEAAKRMQKYPEYLRPAGLSKEWHKFLLDVVGIEPKNANSSAGAGFWENVRDNIIQKETGGFTTRELAEQGIERFVYTKKVQARDAKGHFTSQVIGQKEVVVYRYYETKKFVKISLLKHHKNT